jgi:lantibiotic modifying enzyme
MRQHDLLKDPLTLAREIGDQICSTAEPTDDGCRWLSRHDEELQGYWIGVYLGATGVALFLLNLFERTGEGRYRDVALQALRWIDRVAASPEVPRDRPGLYGNRGGVPYVYLRAGMVTGSSALLQQADVYARACAALEQRRTDLFYGTAGVGLLCLHMHRVTGSQDYWRWAVEAGDTLLQLAEPAGTGCRWHPWSKPPDDPQLRNVCFTGMGHGAAGIGYFLAELFGVTGESRFAEGVRAAARRLLEVAERDGSLWAWDRYDPASEMERLAQWCHGAPGNGLFFLRAFTILGDRELREAAERCAEATFAAGDIRQNPCQCHGLCGNAELFLELYRTLDQPQYLEMAQQFAVLALRYRQETDVGVEWRSHTPGISTPDYLIGSAGVGQFFLRLADPRGTPMPFLGGDG